MKDNAVEPQVNNNYLNFLQDSRGVGFAGKDIKIKELEVQKEIKYELVKNDGYDDYTLFPMLIVLL